MNRNALLVHIASTVSVMAIMLMVSGSVYALPIATPTPNANAAPTNTPTPAPNTRTQPTNTPVPQQPVPTHISTANCDVCGYCNGMTADQIPDRWSSCQQCVYSGFGENIAPTDNKTIQGTVEGIPTPDLYHIYTDFGCLSTEPGEFAQQIANFFFSIVGGIAFLFFIYGSVLIATARSDPGRLQQGKRVIVGAIAGLLFALFSVFIIRLVGSGIGLPVFGG